MLLVSLIGPHSGWLDSLLPTVLLLSFFLLVFFLQLFNCTIVIFFPPFLSTTFQSWILLTQFVDAFCFGLISFVSCKAQECVCDSHSYLGRSFNRVFVKQNLLKPKICLTMGLDSIFLVTALGEGTSRNNFWLLELHLSKQFWLDMMMTKMAMVMVWMMIWERLFLYHKKNCGKI